MLNRVKTIGFKVIIIITDKERSLGSWFNKITKGKGITVKRLVLNILD